MNLTDKAKIGQEVSPTVGDAVNPTDAINKGQVEAIAGVRRSPQGNVSGAVNLDCSLYGVFDLTLTAATDFTLTNLPTGDNTKLITLYLTGAFVWTLAQGTETAGDDYNGAIENRVLIDIVSPTKIYYQIQNIR